MADTQQPGVVAQTAQETGSSVGRFRVWVEEKPWHLWVTVAIGLLGIYVTWRLWQSSQANAGSSGGGFFAGLTGSANTPTGVGATSATAPAVSSSSSSTTQQTYATTTQAEPLYQIAQDLGFGANPAQIEWDPLGPYNGKVKPSYTDLIPAGTVFHVAPGGAGVAPSATETWITQSVTTPQ